MSDPLVTLGSSEDPSPQTEQDGQAGSEGDKYLFSGSARHVAAVLRRMIVGGELPDGVKLPRQQDLLAQFGVSTPSLREALSVLEAEGLVTVQGGTGGAPSSTALTPPLQLSPSGSCSRAAGHHWSTWVRRTQGSSSNAPIYVQARRIGLNGSSQCSRGSTNGPWM